MKKCEKKYLKVLLWHPHLATHGDRLTSILAIRVKAVRLEKDLEANVRDKNGDEETVDLVLLALPVQPDLALRSPHPKSLAPVGDGCGKNRFLKESFLLGKLIPESYLRVSGRIAPLST